MQAGFGPTLPYPDRSVPFFKTQIGFLFNLRFPSHFPRPPLTWKEFNELVMGPGASQSAEPGSLGWVRR